MEITKITPISTIKILRGVRVDSSLNDVMSHANKTAQFNYFNAKTKYTCTNAVPVRNNVVRVPFTADQIYDCNYIMWQNANFADKWFYGFISTITWINVNVSEIEILPDPWETWQFDITYVPCYVQRMHVNSDIVGKWKAPEPFDVSSKLLKLRDMTDYGKKYRVAVFYVPNYDYEPSWVDELTNWCLVSIVDGGNDFIQFFYENLQPLIDEGLQNNIIGGVMVPAFINGIGKSTHSTRLNKENYMNLDGYVPANKKLLTFPYNSLRVASQNGLQGEYWFEKFPSNNMDFVTAGCVSMDLMLYGDFQTYERTPNTPEAIPNMPYTNVVSGFPQPMFSGQQSLGFAQAASALAQQVQVGVRDFAENWTTPVADSIGWSVLGGMAGQTLAAKSDRTRNAFSDAKARAQETFNNSPLGNLLKGIENQTARAAAADYAVITSLPSSTSSWSVFRGNFQFLHSTIDAEKAERYDTYLTRWGYAVEDVTAPIISGRKVFNYIQTKGCNLYGNVPAEDLTLLRHMLDSGLTIWHEDRGYEIGSWDGAPAGNPIV